MTTPAVTYFHNATTSFLASAVHTLDRTILVCDAFVIARRLHMVVSAKLLIAMGQVFPIIGSSQVAECGQQAVAAMVVWRAARGPQRALQPFCKGDEAFAAEDDMGMFEAGIGKAEVIQQTVEQLPSDRDFQTAHVGKIRQAQPSGLLDLTEDDFLLCAMFGAPEPNAPFHREPDAAPKLRLTAWYLLINCDSTNAWCSLKQGDNLRVEDIGRWIWSPASSRFCLLRGKADILPYAKSGGSPDRSLGGSNRDGIILT